MRNLTLRLAANHMTIAPSPRYTSSKADGSAWRTRMPAVAGIAYVVAWTAGLAAWPVNLALSATAEQTAAAYRAHPAEAVVQYLLVEGLAGILLGIVLAGALRTASKHFGVRVTGPAVLSAIAVLTSLTQCVLGLLVTAAAAGGRTASCGTLSDLVNRLDGVKMLALAAAALWIAAGPVLPRWLRVVAVALGLALVVSGYGYLALANGLGWTAYVSGPLLLLWVAGTGVAVTRQRSARERALLPADGADGIPPQGAR
jgi:hypothetical protein